MRNPKPKFKFLIFDAPHEFDKWLKETTFKKIHFKDLGQDMQLIYVHESGEILHSDFHQELYTGQFINMEELAIGNVIEIHDNRAGKFIPYGRLIIGHIE